MMNMLSTALGSNGDNCPIDKCDAARTHDSSLKKTQNRQGENSSDGLGDERISDFMALLMEKTSPLAAEDIQKDAGADFEQGKEKQAAIDGVQRLQSKRGEEFLTTLRLNHGAMGDEGQTIKGKIGKMADSILSNAMTSTEKLANKGAASILTDQQDEMILNSLSAMPTKTEKADAASGEKKSAKRHESGASDKNKIGVSTSLSHAGLKSRETRKSALVSQRQDEKNQRSVTLAGQGADDVGERGGRDHLNLTDKTTGQSPSLVVDKLNIGDKIAFKSMPSSPLNGVEILQSKKSANLTFLHLKLDPEDFGPVEARIRTSGDGLHIDLRAQRAEAARALAQDQLLLTQMIEKSGFGHDAPVHVHVADHGGQATSFLMTQEAQMQSQRPFHGGFSQFPAESGANSPQGEGERSSNGREHQQNHLAQSVEQDTSPMRSSRASRTAYRLIV